MRSLELIKSYARLKPLQPGESSALTYSQQEVSINKTKEYFSFGKTLLIQMKCSAMVPISSTPIAERELH